MTELTTTTTTTTKLIKKKAKQNEIKLKNRFKIEF
jgi:hypothetical protein